DSATTLLAHPNATPGRHIRINVTDNGPGITDEILPRIFDPFFTTKPIGEGSGLGLATSYGIARQHRGWIDVKTRVGHGSTFSVYLPIAEVADEPPLTDFPVTGIPADPSQLRGFERILIVED